MPVPMLNQEKCSQRNRIAARLGVDTAPITFLRQLPATSEPDGLLYAHGTLPRSDEAALALINAKLPADSTPLTPEDVYIRYAEAGNGSFVGDRFAFLDGSTLRNVAHDAAEGFAFMNSHRTGSMSHPSELPYGRTFAGRYEKYRSIDGKQPIERTLLGFYMLRGIKPNGANGPSTDDLHASIGGGTLFDVSLGLTGEGYIKCDVCGHMVRHRDMHTGAGEWCAHAPGTTREMSKDEVVAQQERGVRDGRASYTIVDDHANEFSGVYDGAIAGAGFQVAMSLAKQHKLSPFELAQARTAFAPLLTKGDFNMDQAIEEVSNGVASRVLRALGFKRSDLASLQDIQDESENEEETKLEKASSTASNSPDQAASPAPGGETLSPNDPRLAELADLKAKFAARTAEEIQDRAETFANGLVERSVALPHGRPQALALYRQLALDDAANPAPVAFIGGDGTEQKLSRAEALAAMFSALPAHSLTKETKVGDLPPGSILLGADRGPVDPAAEGRKEGESFVDKNFPEKGKK